MTTSAPRDVNYDAIAHLYDAQPYRDKQPDPNLLAWLRDHPVRAVLDMCCGTGNQLIANRPHLPDATLVGLDASHGMLRQARAKAPDVAWLHADSTHPPLADHSFDYISHQFAFHHIADKPAAARALFRILRPGGRLVMTNLNPHTMQDWLYYRYFPAAQTRDRQDFLSHDALEALMREAGFNSVTVELETVSYEENLRDFMGTVQRRDTCSQLITLPDADYREGLEQLAADVARGSTGEKVRTGITLVTLKGERG